MHTKAKVFILVVLLVVLAGVVLHNVGISPSEVLRFPELISRPSRSTVEEVVLTHTAGRTNYGWVRQVEIVAYGRPYTVQLWDLPESPRLWPVKVYLIGEGRKDLKRVDLYRDHFDQWKVESIRDDS